MKNYRTVIFFAKTNEAREVCCGREVEGTFMHIRGFISHQQTTSVACSQRVSESVYAALVALLFCTKMTERLEQRYCIKFCQKFGDSQVETVRKIQRVFGHHAMGITQIEEWYNRFNPLKPELNLICHLLALFGAHHFLHVSRIRVKSSTFRLLMSYIYIWSTHS